MLKHGILGLLNYGDMTGYEIRTVFKDSLNHFWQAQTSQIYRELQALEKNGWITSSHVEQKGKPDKNIHSIHRIIDRNILIEAAHCSDRELQHSFRLGSVKCIAAHNLNLTFHRWNYTSITEHQMQKTRIKSSHLSLRCFEFQIDSPSEHKRPDD